MPKDTFYNLNNEKKEKIFDAAVSEFSIRRFSEASINQIVKTADIPRGSFYQYFSGKEDIYLYIVSEIEKKQAVVLSFIERHADRKGAFDELIYQARAAIELYRIRPNYRLIALMAEKDDSEFIANIRSRPEEKRKIEELLERDKQRGLIKQDTDAEVVADMAYSLIKMEYLRAGRDGGAIIKRINEIVKIIYEGIAV